MGFLSKVRAQQPINVAALHLALKSSGAIDRDVLMARYPDVSVGEREAAAMEACALYERASALAATMRPGIDGQTFAANALAARAAIDAEFPSWPGTERRAALQQLWHEQFDSKDA